MAGATLSRALEILYLFLPLLARIFHILLWPFRLFYRIAYILLYPVRLSYRTTRLLLYTACHPIRTSRAAYRRYPRTACLLAVLALITSPITLLPLAHGVADGYWLCIETLVDQVATERMYFAQNMALMSLYDSMTIPGMPKPGDIPKEPFYITEHKDPRRWWNQLDLVKLDLPRQDNPSLQVVRDRASLEGLYRRSELRWDLDERSAQQDEDWHHFVYVAEPNDIDTLVRDESFEFSSLWNKAFNELLQYHYMYPAVGNASFSWIQQEHFLPTLWDVRAPAFVHLTTAEPEVFMPDGGPFTGYPDMRRRGNYKTVAARVWEFGQHELALWSRPLVFPTPFHQMLSVTADAHTWELMPVWSYMAQTFQHADGVMSRRAKEWPRTYGRLSALAERVRAALGEGSLGFVTDVIYGWAALSVWGTASIAALVYVELWSLLSGSPEESSQNHNGLGTANDQDGFGRAFTDFLNSRPSQDLDNEAMQDAVQLMKLIFMRQPENATTESRSW